MRMLYKYPQVEYPYELLYRGNRRRGRANPEFELIDALRRAVAAGRYFDVFVDLAKAGIEDDILCRITAYNRGPEPAPLHILPPTSGFATPGRGAIPTNARCSRRSSRLLYGHCIGTWASFTGEHLDIEPHTPSAAFRRK